MKHFSIYDMEKKKAIFESNDVIVYDISTFHSKNNGTDSTEITITLIDNVECTINLKNDNKYAISIMNLTGDKNE